MALPDYVLDDIIAELNSDQLRLLAEFWARLDILTDGRIPEFSSKTLEGLKTQTVSLPSGEQVEVDMSTMKKKAAQKALKDMTPEALLVALRRNVKHEDPDTLLVRFLRARKYNIDDAMVMLLKSLAWRIETKIEEDLLSGGDIQYFLQSKYGSGHEQQVAKEAIALLSSGVSAVHGQDKEGRVVQYLRIKMHNPKAQGKDGFEKATILSTESTRMLLRPPQTNVSVVFDLTDFGMRNMDMTALKVMAGGLQDNYPESLGMVYVYNAPKIVGNIWTAVKGWLDPVVASKVKFLNTIEDLAEYIAIEDIPSYMGGKSDWEPEWVPPQRQKPLKPEEEANRNQLQAERQQLLLDHAEATRAWSAQLLIDGSPKADTVAGRRRIAQALRDNYWRLDPYVRGRVQLDRSGVLLPGGKVNLKANSQADSGQ